MLDPDSNEGFDEGAVHRRVALRERWRSTEIPLRTPKSVNVIFAGTRTDLELARRIAALGRSRKFVGHVERQG